jgi:poly(3-hydroxybutyrate) depolymerase
MTRHLIIAIVLVFGFSGSAVAQKVRKETFESQGKKRTYYLVVPDGASAARPAPLLMLFHGSGRDGLSLVDKWKDLAVKEGIILAGPDAIASAGWNVPADGPDYLNELTSELISKYPVDVHRIYLFGHSAGASFALYMALFESQYFAAAAIHAGALRDNDEALVVQAVRKIPIHMTVGTVDRSVPLSMVRSTRELLKRNGFNAELTEMQGHDHWYYDLAPKINAEAWAFLKQHRLDGDPQFKHYTFR